jgi:hypothetical protein
VPSSVPAAAPAPAATGGRAVESAPRGDSAHAATRESRAWIAAPALVAAVVSIAYLVVEPRTVDLAAGFYRTDLFGEEGLAIWNGNWYGGHHTLGYSVLFPPLAWLVGPRLLGAVAAVAAAVLFERIARRRWGERARWGALWFGLAATAPVVSGRIPFALGVAFGLAAVLALQRGRPWLAAALGLACALASPVAGAFLALGGLAYALAEHRRRRGLVLLAAGLGPPLALALVFPGGGREPFELSAFLPLPALALGFAALLPREERTLRTAAILYAVACCAAYAVDSPMGGNAVRLGALAGGPLLACALPAHRRHVGAGAVAVLAAFAFIQWSPAIRDTVKAFEDPAVEASYYAPLVDFLERADGGVSRVEIPFTRSHWEAHEVARRFPLARGWERQADIDRNGIFYDGVLNRLTYATWLTERGVRFVALPDGKPDYSSYRERALIESGLPYLRLRWRSDHWRVYEVTLPRPMVVPRAGARISLTGLGVDEARLRVDRPGEATVRVAWSPYWRADAGACVERAGEWTRVTARRPGAVRLRMDFAPSRILSRGRRCG